MNNYTGKTIYIGLDVHKKTYSIAAMCDSEIIKKATINADYTTLHNFIKKYFPGANQINTAYEAGFSGFGLHRFLVENNINSIVVHAASIEVSARDRVKTDRRDAVKIATQLSAKRLKCVYIPTKEQEARRSLSRHRETLIKDKTRITLRIKHFLFQNDLPSIWDGKQKLSKKWVERALEYEFELYELTYVFRSFLKQWLELTKKIKDINKELEKQASNDKLNSIYLSVPGVGSIAARILSNELGNMEQFGNEKKLFSFTGLTPSEYSSGEHIRQGSISKQGRPCIRRILILSAWVAIRKDKSLEEIYCRISRAAGGKRAIVAVARRLIGRIRTCLQTGSLYQIQAV
jgi:transposase